MPVRNLPARMRARPPACRFRAGPEVLRGTDALHGLTRPARLRILLHYQRTGCLCVRRRLALAKRPLTPQHKQALRCDTKFYTETQHVRPPPMQDDSLASGCGGSARVSDADCKPLANAKMRWSRLPRRHSVVVHRPVQRRGLLHAQLGRAHQPGPCPFHRCPAFSRPIFAPARALSCMRRRRRRNRVKRPIQIGHRPIEYLATS